MDLGLLSINTMDELGSVFVRTTRIGLAMHGSSWLLHSHLIGEATVDILIRMKSKNNYNFKSVFETRRDNVVDQYFKLQNNYMK